MTKRHHTAHSGRGCSTKRRCTRAHIPEGNTLRLLTSTLPFMGLVYYMNKPNPYRTKGKNVSTSKKECGSEIFDAICKIMYPFFLAHNLRCSYFAKCSLYVNSYYVVPISARLKEDLDVRRQTRRCRDTTKGTTQIPCNMNAHFEDSRHQNEMSMCDATANMSMPITSTMQVAVPNRSS